MVSVLARVVVSVSDNLYVPSDRVSAATASAAGLSLAKHSGILRQTQKTAVDTRIIDAVIFNAPNFFLKSPPHKNICR